MPDTSIPSTLNQPSVDYNMLTMVNYQPHPLEGRRDPEPPITSLRKSVHAAESCMFHLMARSKFYHLFQNGLGRNQHPDPAKTTLQTRSTSIMGPPLDKTNTRMKCCAPL
ncbi:hypothetical protein BHE74_00006373 [Ensete ventricosum]|nr:hypothetical protein BHE74_00006373 [Ensete ventricosum]